MKPASDKPRRRFLKQSAALVSSMAGMAASECAPSGEGCAPSGEAPPSVSSASSRELERTTLEALGRIVLPKRALGDEGVSSVLDGFATWLSGFEAVAELDHPYLWTDEIAYGPPDPAPLWRSQLEALELEAALLHRSGRERNPPMVVAAVCSTMKYPKRSQYKHAKQKKYHIRNWPEYTEGLRRRGDLTVWFDEEAIANWKADKTGKPGGQRVYSDMAIETGLVVRMVYKLAYRQTEGFLHSIASLLGLGIEIPDYSTLCRRSRLLRKKLRIPKAASNQPIHLMIDSTGLRIHVGTARKPPKQRAWRKLHIAVDRKTGNIVASELTASRARDATRVPALLRQIQAPLASATADSAYDKEAVYEAIEAHSPGRRTRVVIPPQRNATLSQNSNTAMQERDRHIRAIERHGRREWYKLSGCTERSMVENAVYRYKAIIGPEMRARTLARQRVEHRMGCEILNKMTALGMPDTYCAG